MTAPVPGPWFSPEHPPVNRRWNVWCVAALASLIFGIFAFWPLLLVAVVLGFVGVAQVRRTRERGLWMAVVSIVTVPVFLLLVTVVLGYLGHRYVM